MNNTNFAPWQKRGTALFDVIEHQVKTMRAEQDMVSRKGTLIALLTALRAFGESQLAFFTNGFDATYGGIHLEPSIEYPPEYAMRATVDQIAYDLDVIQRAYQQRLPSQASSTMRDLLAKADHLAYQALKPAIDRKLIADVTVITYFQKAVNVRIIPYAPVALIGLPLSALAVPQDLLAIPHEVGHYVYRHGRTGQGATKGSRFDAALRRQLGHLPTWTLAWLEEIFADVYGALVGGPIMALGFTDLVTDDPYADFVEDDGEHPIAALRPDIYHSVLQTHAKNERALNLLFESWDQWRKQRGNPTHFVPSGETEKVSLEDAMAQINAVIQSLLTGDLGGISAETALWSSPLGPTDTTDALYTAFAAMINGLAVNDGMLAPELDVVPQAGTRAIDAGGDTGSDAGSNHEVLELHLIPLRSKNDGAKEDGGVKPLYDSSGAVNRVRRLGETEQWFDALKRDPAMFNIPPSVWMALLDGSGWATEGPGGAHAH